MADRNGSPNTVRRQRWFTDGRRELPVTAPRRKLIEVSLPLEAINAASAREKSIRHGHPSTLHLWWARRPLAACRAVLFASLVDDPSSWPEEFPTEEAQEQERKRLHQVIAEMVQWKASGDGHVMGKARYEIARSLARGRGEAPPARGDTGAVLAYLAEHAPPVCDPFCGGGSIPLEAQRLGLRARGSDLNPVAVLVSKATCEIPPKFVGRPPVNPDADPHVVWRGARGLAEDVRYYGAWMRDRARERIGHLYPKVPVTAAMAEARPDLKPYAGQELTVIAWLWARTVASPDPMLRGAHVPLASSFVLSSKKGKEAIVVPVVENGGYRFTVKAGGIGPDELAKARTGAKVGRGANFACLLSGTPLTGDHVKAEGMAGRMGARLIAVVAEGRRGRVYLDPTEEMEAVARGAEPPWRPDATISGSTQYLGVKPYGMTRFDQLFTDRQLVALATFSDLVSEAREQIERDSLAAPASREQAHEARTNEEAGEQPALPEDDIPPAEGGTGAQAYVDAVATYLGLGVGRAADYWSSIATWANSGEFIRSSFARQAIPMVWDFAESNPFSSASGNWDDTAMSWVAKAVQELAPAGMPATVIQQHAAGDTPLVENAMVATDPPYYDNVPYADISDFFYVWQRRTLRSVCPDLFRRLLTPKDEELVAFSYRHDSKGAAEEFFMDGMSRALRNMHVSGADAFPATVYYAFKQSEVAKEGLTSPGWATFLQGVVDAGYIIDGTWPVRTERTARSISIGANALASSIVLVCRKRPADAPTITRREFVARLRAKLPAALKHIRAGGVGPVDMAQAALGPGMGVFTACARVLEPDDTPMTVRAAIALINRTRDEISGEEATGYDPETRFCIDWFEAFGTAAGDSGDAITMAQAYDIGIDALVDAGAVATQGGTARLLRRDELPADWNSAADRHLTHWECAQHLARVLEAPDGGSEAAARLLTAMGPDNGEAARLLAYRLYDVCERKGRAEEARVWNMLAQEWPAIEAAARRPSLL